MATEVFQYKPQGVCCQLMQLAINDGIIEDVQFFGGCNGNLQGISKLVKGMNVNDVIKKLEGTTCGSKSTSCPDQLTKALNAYITHLNAQKV